MMPVTSLTRSHDIALIPGDGVGTEVVPAAASVLETVGEEYSIEFNWTTFPWGCQHFLDTGGHMMPTDGLEQLARFDAVFLGAVGWPTVPDHVSLWGLLIPIRRGFRQFVNLRPIRLFPGVPSPLAEVRPEDVDICVVRENSEGEYSEIGGRLFQGTEYEMAVQESVFTVRGIDQIMRYAFELAMRRGKHVTSATKSNGIIHTMPLWDERFGLIAEEYPEVRTDQFHIDALSAYMIQRPSSFDVIVASNLFGDILSDIGAAIAGSIGLAPAANINPAGDTPSMFEPVHGSAPDIAGLGIANPLGQIWTGAMMLDHLGHQGAAASLERAIAHVMSRPEVRSVDLGGTATTAEVVAAVISEFRYVSRST